MKLPNFITKTITKIKPKLVKKSPDILTGLAIVGLGATVIFAIKETPIAEERKNDKIEELKRDYLEKNGDKDPECENFKPSRIEIAKVVVPVYIPTIGTGAVTLLCIIGARVASAKQQALIASLYSSSEAAFKAYQDKVVEMIGQKKEQKIRDEVNKDYLERRPISEYKVYSTGQGDTLIYEPLTGRLFTHDIDKLRRIVVDLQGQTMREMWITANEMFEAFGLESVGSGEYIGWNVDHMLDIYFTSQLLDDGRVCAVIGYAQRPIIYKPRLCD